MATTIRSIPNIPIGRAPEISGSEQRIPIRKRSIPPSINESPPVPTITSFSPSTGVNTGSVSVKMVKGSTILTGAVTSIGSNKIICTLPTKGAGSGVWSLKVTNSDTTAVTKTNTFAVRDPE
ncbi:MAG: hypothetical protein GXY48_08505 [Methanomicrobiales archaeon]|nr:hypothetical protein [Methanomicrobiales archaeon]